jgi:hypothetical protein
LVERIETIRNEPNVTVDRARSEITRLRSIAEQQIADSDQLIARLRSQLGQSDQTEIQLQVDEQLTKIQAANLVIEQLLEQKFAAERDYRILEAEVGPIKYIAEFVYGETDKDLLEEAVRWVIITIIFVFDPLAVLLLIASQYTFEFERKKRIVQQEATNEIEQESNRETTDAGEEDIVNETSTFAVGTGHEERSVAVPQGTIESQRTQELLELDDDVNWKEAKHRWKENHPTETLKDWKEKYVRGEIDSLPWEDDLKGNSYQQNAEQNENSIWNRINKRNE